jgi:hypothetical protein
VLRPSGRKRRSEPDVPRQRAPTTTEPESGLEASNHFEPEAAEDEIVEDAPPGSNVPLTPLTSEQERQLSVAVKALARLQRGFEDRHVAIVRGLRAARQAAWQAACDASDRQQRKSLKLPSGQPNYHADDYRQRFRELLLRSFGDYWYAPGEKQPVRNNRRALLSAYLSIGENLEKPVDKKHRSKPGFLDWYRELQEGARWECPKRLWAAYRAEVLEIREPKLETRSERDKERHGLEQRIVGLTNENTALLTEVVELRTLMTDEERLAQAAIALGPERARAVMERIAALLRAEVAA